MKRILFLLFSLLIASDQIPAPRQDHPILIQGGTIHTVSGRNLPQTDILFENGIITRIEKHIQPEPDMAVIDATDRHIYPGLIASVSTMGLVEVGAVRATADYNEVGSVTPEVRANVSYNPDSEIIPVTRSNGVLFANVMPKGGRIPGQSSLMMLDGWTWEEATFNHPTALHIVWPGMWLNLNPNAKKSVPEQEKAIREALTELDRLFDKVIQYKKIQDHPPRARNVNWQQDIRLETMIPYVLGEKRIFIHANDLRQIESAVNWALKRNIDIAIVGGADAWRVADLLKQHQIPVIIEGILRVPYRRFEDYDAAYALPRKLFEKGVPYCISTAGNPFQAPHGRDLPNHAAMAAAFGLPPQEALRAITLYPARILGVADRIGSLEVGKEASLFIATGDILEITTTVEQDFIQGRKIDMNDKHKMLYRKYQEKYKQLGILGDN
ncbi:MAG: amidohydrolase family protein [Fidelibacterota bacterium]